MVVSNIVSGTSQAVAATLLLSGHPTLWELAALGASITGAAIGGVIVAVTNPGTGILVDAISFLVAALALSWLRLPAGLRAASTSMLHELREGWHDFWSRTWLWAIVLQFGIVNAAESGTFLVLRPNVAKHHLGARRRGA